MFTINQKHPCSYAKSECLHLFQGIPSSMESFHTHIPIKPCKSSSLGLTLVTWMGTVNFFKCAILYIYILLRRDPPFLSVQYYIFWSIEKGFLWKSYLLCREKQISQLLLPFFFFEGRRPVSLPCLSWFDDICTWGVCQNLQVPVGNVQLIWLCPLESVIK